MSSFPKALLQVCCLSSDGKQRQDRQIAGTEAAIRAFAGQLTRDDQVALEVTFHTWAIHALLNRRLIPRPEGWTPFAQKTRRWMRGLELPPAERFMLDNALDLLADIESRVDAVDERFLQHATTSRSTQILMTLPGVDVTVAIGLLAAIDDIHRFATPQKLASYFGLVPSVHQSAARCYHGSITKTGNSTARALAVEAAQTLARSSTPLAATFYRVRQKRGYNVAVTALARKLIHVVWHLLKNDEPYRYAPVSRTRHKLMKVRGHNGRCHSVPKTIDGVYAEAGLPQPRSPSPAEKRSATNNRRTRTRLANRSNPRNDNTMTS